MVQRMPLMGLLQLRLEHDTLQHATRFFVRSHTRSIRALHENQCVSCMLIDSSMHTAFTLYLYRPIPYIVCVNMPEIVYTNAIKCQYAEYTINHCEIIVMLK